MLHCHWAYSWFALGGGGGTWKRAAAVDKWFRKACVTSTGSSFVFLLSCLLTTAGPALEAMRRMGIVAYYVSGRSSDAPALLAAGAKRARSLMYVGPSERPTSLPTTAVSGVYGDPTSTREAGHTDVSSRCAGGAGWITEVIRHVIYASRFAKKHNACPAGQGTAPSSCPCRRVCRLHVAAICS